MSLNGLKEWHAGQLFTCGGIGNRYHLQYIVDTLKPHLIVSFQPKTEKSHWYEAKCEEKGICCKKIPIEYQDAVYQDSGRNKNHSMVTLCASIMSKYISKNKRVLLTTYQEHKCHHIAAVLVWWASGTMPVVKGITSPQREQMAVIQREANKIKGWQAWEKKESNKDLLNCICLSDSSCTRGCRVDGELFKPESKRFETLRFNIGGDEDCHQAAWMRVERFEEGNPSIDILALEAWSNGVITMWT